LFHFSYARTDAELLKDIVGDVLKRLPPRCRNQCKGRMGIEDGLYIYYDLFED